MNHNFAISHPKPGESTDVPVLTRTERVRRRARKVRHTRRRRKQAKLHLAGGSSMWYPNAKQMPGKNAGYAAGRVDPQGVGGHYTVGRNSTGIGLNGYFTLLVTRDGDVEQYAEADAVTWAQCEYNRYFCGIEVEFLESFDGPAPENIITPAAEAALADVLRWLTEVGFPVDPFHDGDHFVQPGGGYGGTYTHRCLAEHQCDNHYDYWPEDAFNRMRSNTPQPPPPAPPRPKGDHTMFLAQNADKPEELWRFGETTYELMFGQEYFQLAISGMPHCEKVGGWVLEEYRKGRTRIGFGSSGNIKVPAGLEGVEMGLTPVQAAHLGYTP